MVGISYVTTVYNKRPYLPAVVAGLTAQRGDLEREYVFVDDGSSDGSADELERLTGGLPNVTIHRQENAGMSRALNQALALARLPLIKTLDADDVLLPDASEVLLSALQAHNAVVAIGWDGRYEPGTVPDLGSYQDPRGQHDATVFEDPLDWVMERARFNPSCMLARADAVQRSGGCDTGLFIGDYSWSLRLACLGRFVTVDRTVFLAPQEAEGRISDNGAQVLHDLNLALANFVEQTPDLSATRRWQAARRAAGRAWHWARRVNGEGFLGPYHRIYLRSLISGRRNAAALCRESCGAFVESGQVRVMPAASA